MNRKRETLQGYLFLAPALIVFAVLVVFPVIFSAVLSLCKWDFTSGFGGIEFVGFKNYLSLLEDKIFGYAFINTFVYALAVVPVSIILSLFLAYLLNEKVFMKKTLRTVFFIPYIASTVAVAALFRYLFRVDGPINMVLVNQFGFSEPVNWLSDNSLNKIPIILLLIWTSIGYEMLVYMGALQTVSKELYEASEIDGAGKLVRFFRITVPMVSPITFYLLIVRIIAIFKVFSYISIITYRNLAQGNTSIVLKVYEDAFGQYQFGYASAEAWILFFIIFIFTFVQMRGQKAWVHY